MRKKLLSLAAALLLLFSIQCAANAEEFANLGSHSSGANIDCFISFLEPTAVIDADGLPEGCEIVEEQRLEGKALSLRGKPLYAGRYDFIISVYGTSNYIIICSINIEPASPMVISCPPIECVPNTPVMLYVTTSASDGGSLSYQWFAGVGASAVALIGETRSSYFPGTDTVGTAYYQCVVTNTNNGVSCSVTSEPMTVKVKGNSIVSVELASRPNKTTYAVGETLDLTGLVLKVNTEDASSYIDNNYTASPMVLTTPGMQTIQISFAGKSCYFKVTVSSSPVVDGIGVLTLPSKTTYKVGESLNTSGLSIRAYSGKTQFDVSEGLECSPTVMSRAGSQTITVKYGDKTCTFSVTVEEEKEQIRSVTLANKPYRLEYTVGDTLDSSGLSLRIQTNKSTKDITSGFTCTPKQLNVPGTQTITVYYEQYSCTFDVKVLPKASPTPSPTSTPTPMQTPMPTASQGSDGQGTSSTPASEPSYTPSRTDRDNGATALVKVGLIVALIAMGGIVGCIYVLNHSDSIDFSKLFKGKRKR